jgi:IS30 family transposase
MRHYSHLSLEEREKLYKMKNNGLSLRAIAVGLNRSHSTILREIKRNTDYSRSLGYLPDTAQSLTSKRIARHGSKLSRHPELKEIIISKMRDNRWSPEMIAGRLKLDGARVTISHESIYQYIYSAEGIKLGLYRYLMCRRPKRNQYYGRKARSNHGIPNRVSISQRPEIKPGEFGHFEADTTFFKGSKSVNLLTMVERKTSFFIAELNESKDSEIIVTKLLRNLINFPRKKRKSVTMDNGKEFTKHEIIRQVSGTPTFFCHPGSPWEKPYVESSHALLHRFIPKNTDPRTLTKGVVQNAVNLLNQLPRKRFNFKTPAEMMEDEPFLTSGALVS